MNDIGLPINVRKRSWLSWSGVLLSIIGFFVAATGPWLGGYLDPPPKPLDEIAAEFIIKTKDRVAAKLKGSELVAADQPKPIRWSEKLPAIAIGLGAVGFSLGIIGLARRECVRVAVCAIAVGMAAVVFQYAILLAGALLFIMIMYIIVIAVTSDGSI